MIFFRIIIFPFGNDAMVAVILIIFIFSDITPFFRLNSLSCLFLYETLDIYSLTDEII